MEGGGGLKHTKLTVAACVEPRIVSHPTHSASRAAERVSFS